MSPTTRNRLIVGGVVVAMLVVPVAIFRQQTGTMAHYLGPVAPPGQGAYIVMRPAGHLALTLAFIQIVLGYEPRGWARRLGVRTLVPTHMALGITVLALAFLHPFLFFWARTLRAGQSAFMSTFLPQPTDYYHTRLWLGAMALYGLGVGFVAARFGRRRFPRHWRTVHRLNYVVFLVAWYHAISIGSETRHPTLVVLYSAMAAIVAALLLLRARLVLRGRSRREVDDDQLAHAHDALGSSGIEDTISRALEEVIGAALRRRLAERLRSGDGVDRQDAVLDDSRRWRRS